MKVNLTSFISIFFTNLGYAIWSGDVKCQLIVIIFKLFMVLISVRVVKIGSQWENSKIQGYHSASTPIKWGVV